MILHRVPVPLMHETHVHAVQRIVDVVEVVANPVQTGNVEGDFRTLKSWIARQRRRLALPR